MSSRDVTWLRTDRGYGHRLLVARTEGWNCTTTFCNPDLYVQMQSPSFLGNFLECNCKLERGSPTSVRGHSGQEALVVLVRIGHI